MSRQEELELVNQQILHAEHLIALQQAIIDRLQEFGEPTKLADGLMTRMQAGLAARLRHREQIEAELDQRNDEAPDDAAFQAQQEAPGLNE